MKRLNEPRRAYERYSHSPDERNYLAQQGLQAVQSSNVSAVGVIDNNLIIRFINGSLYVYYGQEDKFDNILRSNSKGHWVWVNLRRKPVRYEKIGTLPLPSDEQLEDEDIFNLVEREAVETERAFKAMGLYIPQSQGIDFVSLNGLLK